MVCIGIHMTQAIVFAFMLSETVSPSHDGTPYLVSVSDGDRETVSHLPHLLQKMVRIHGHREALLSVLALLQPTCST